jgi:hypothetical protein
LSTRDPFSYISVAFNTYSKYYCQTYKYMHRISCCYIFVVSLSHTLLSTQKKRPTHRYIERARLGLYVRNEILGGAAGGVVAGERNRERKVTPVEGRVGERVLGSDCEARGSGSLIKEWSEGAAKEAATPVTVRVTGSGAGAKAERVHVVSKVDLLRSGKAVGTGADGGRRD